MNSITTEGWHDHLLQGLGQRTAIVFSHGWPLTADDWDAQMMFFLKRGYRVVAHDRRGHGRSTQTADGHDMDHYADDLAALTAHLDLKNAIHVGHSTGGGEVDAIWLVTARGASAKAVLISAVPPSWSRHPRIQEAFPRKSSTDFRRNSAANRAQFYRDVPAGPFYGYNRPGAKVSEGHHSELVATGHDGGAKAHYDGIVAFSQTEFTADLRKITVPTLVMHGDDDQIVPYADSRPLAPNW